MEEHWSVSIEINGETVLTIGHNYLAGVNNIEDYADEVRRCVEHLLAFIGDGNSKISYFDIE